MILSSLTIKHFKKLEEISIPLSPINILVGGNNSGKTCVLQAAHFGISVLQSGRFVKERYGLTPKTLSSEQLRYIPTDDLMRLSHKRPISQNHGIEISYVGKKHAEDETEEAFQIRIRRGKNANLSITFPDNHKFYHPLSNNQNPFSIYVPGLAGIPLREEFRADSVITSGISRGDANLFLRNVLLRLQRNPERFKLFHEIFQSIFPNVRIKLEFLEQQDMYINCHAEVDSYQISLDMLGTGVLQVVQLVAYVVNYNPSILLLDEPDSHLHPDNQRKLAETLVKVAENTDTKIILATHSRHLLDSFQDSEHANTIWLKDGKIQSNEVSSDINMLLDLGALDSGERLLNDYLEAVILTEDTNYGYLETFLKTNGIPLQKCLIFPYKGISRTDAAVAVVSFLNRVRPGVPVIFHRDADMASDAEREKLFQKYSDLRHYNCHIFITEYSDIEHYFCTIDHISSVYGISNADATSVVDNVINENSNTFIRKYMRKRDDLAKDIYDNPNKEAPSVERLLPNSGITWNQCLGKTLMGKIRNKIETDLGLPNKKISEPSPHLQDASLDQIKNAIWGSTTSGR